MVHFPVRYVSHYQRVLVEVCASKNHPMFCSPRFGSLKLNVQSTKMNGHLVGGLEYVFFFHILGMIIPFDLYFFRGSETTNQSFYGVVPKMAYLKMFIVFFMCFFAWNKNHVLFCFGISPWPWKLLCIGDIDNPRPVGFWSRLTIDHGLWLLDPEFENQYRKPNIQFVLCKGPFPTWDLYWTWFVLKMLRW